MAWTIQVSDPPYADATRVIVDWAVKNGATVVATGNQPFPAGVKALDVAQTLLSILAQVQLAQATASSLSGVVGADFSALPNAVKPRAGAGYQVELVQQLDGTYQGTVTLDGVPLPGGVVTGATSSAATTSAQTWKNYYVATHTPTVTNLT